MGFQAIVDCYEDMTTFSWNSRKEVLTWGAGAQLIMRVRNMGADVKHSWQNDGDEDRLGKNDQHYHRNSWMSYQEDRHRDGSDDITSVNLLKPGQVSADNVERVILGRASGGLEYVDFSFPTGASRVRTKFETNGRPVRSADVSKTTEPLLAACLSDSAVAIYPTHTQSDATQPVGEVSVVPTEKSGRSWTTRFLRSDLLATGLGPSHSPIQVHTLSPSGIIESPLRVLDSGKLDTEISTRAPLSSVYAIAPLAPSFLAGGSEGDLFLSGYYEGTIQLHDLRSPEPYTAQYYDCIDPCSAIYSLLPLGRERFVAGTARHTVMKVFDLRMPGGKVYYAADAEACSPISYRQTPARAPKVMCCNYHNEMKYDRKDYNIFLDPHGRTAQRNGYRRQAESPIYSLAASSAYSSSIYAGLENNVVQIDIMSMMDKHPDPIFKHRVKIGSSNRDGSVSRYDPPGSVLNLSLLEQDRHGSMKLKSQTGLGVRHSHGMPGWDERWLTHSGKM